MPGAPESRLLLFPLALDYPQDVVSVEDHVVLAVEADLGARVLGEDDDVALADLDPVLELADGDDFCRLRLSLAVSGRTIPEAVSSSRSTIWTSARSPKGLNFISLTSLYLRTYYDAPRDVQADPARRDSCARDCNRECCSSQLQAELCR